MKCGRCRRQHPPKRYPAWGKSCLKCGGRTKSFCRNVQEQFSERTIVQGDDRDDDQFFLDTLFIEKSDEWHAVIGCNDTRVRVKLDTGAATKCDAVWNIQKSHTKTADKAVKHCAQSVWRSTGGTYREVSARVFSEWPQQAM